MHNDIKKDIVIEKYLHQNFIKDYNSKICKNLVNSRKLESFNIDVDILNLLPFLIYDEFTKFLKNNLNFKNEIFVYDKNIKKTILFSLTNLNKVNVKDDIVHQNFNYLPRSF